jgi:hypothetical protein
MKPRRVIACALGLWVAGHLAGCSAVLGIGDLPPATDDDAGGASSSGMGAAGGGLGIGSIGTSPTGSNVSGSSSSNGGATCNPNQSTACNSCLASQCCASATSCDDDQNCSGAFSCISSTSTVDDFCACLSRYGGFLTIWNSQFTACYAQNCTGQCGVVSTLPVGASCSTTQGCFLGPCVENANFTDTCFQFCCSDSDCASGSCTNAVDIQGGATRVCAG